MNRMIVVRTQVAEKWWRDEVRERGTLPSEEWLASREPFLSRVAAASLEKVAIPFVWVWTTAPQLRDHVVEIASRIFPAALVVNTGDVPDIGCGPYLTVRLDSDDAILPSAIDALATMHLDRGWLVDWPRGWMLEWETGRIAEREWPWRRQSPFLAMTHETRAHVLDLGPDHSVARSGRMQRVITARSWIQTIHGGNVMNKWRDAEPVDAETRRRVLSAAGIEDMW